MKAINIVQDILSKKIDKNEITYKKVNTEVNIMYKNNPEHWICKIELGAHKMIRLPNGSEDYLEYKMDAVIDINELKNELVFIAEKYIK